MVEPSQQVAVLACSGIGKTWGALARETAHELVERVRPGVAVLTCLPLLVIHDPEAQRLVLEHPVITLDGCPKACARKSVEAAGGRVDHACETMPFYTAHRELKPEGVARLNAAGLQLARVAAGELAAVVDRLAAGEQA